jgi:TBC1 domain family protein 5
MNHRLGFTQNPYEIYRRDQELRQEILQDVERCMPENTFFREPSVQSSLLDILFIFCKLNQDVSYRQGFHELVAVIYWVVSCDAISTSSPTNEDDMVKDEAVMREALDRSYIEHDTFSLFRVLMRAAKAWYELDDGGRSVRKGDTAGISPIVQKSRYIHETLLMATDPELGEHLKSLDVLPQVFLMLVTLPNMFSFIFSGFINFKSVDGYDCFLAENSLLMSF